MGSFFFFQQKTAYEVRISDWSSDVCSSDLAVDPALLQSFPIFHIKLGITRPFCDLAQAFGRLDAKLRGAVEDFLAALASCSSPTWAGRSEARRVGKECGRKCRYRWSQEH